MKRFEVFLLYGFLSLTLNADSSFFSDRSDDQEAPFMKTFQVDIGRGNLFYQIPSQLPISRSFQDAWVNDGQFVPEYLRAIPYFPQQTGLTSSTTSLQMRWETDIWNMFYLGLGIGYRDYNPTGEAIQTVTRRNDFQRILNSELSLLNQLRSTAFNNITYLPFTAEYWVSVHSRFPLWFWESSFLRPYLDLGLGLGGCVDGESCNVSSLTGGLGAEFNRIQWRFVPFLDLRLTNIHQQRVRWDIIGEEKSFHFGVRYYR